jgi:hypothetical protein
MSHPLKADGYGQPGLCGGLPPDQPSDFIGWREPYFTNPLLHVILSAAMYKWVHVNGANDNNTGGILARARRHAC